MWMLQEEGDADERDADERDKTSKVRTTHKRHLLLVREDFGLLHAGSDVRGHRSSTGAARRLTLDAQP